MKHQHLFRFVQYRAAQDEQGQIGQLPNDVEHHVQLYARERNRQLLLEFPCNIKETNTFRVLEYCYKDNTAMVDKDFLSKANIEMLSGLDGIIFTMTLKRNTEEPDYLPFSDRKILNRLGNF